PVVDDARFHRRAAVESIEEAAHVSGAEAYGDQVPEHVSIGPNATKEENQLGVGGDRDEAEQDEDPEDPLRASTRCVEKDSGQPSGVVFGSARQEEHGAGPAGGEIGQVDAVVGSIRYHTLDPSTAPAYRTTSCETPHIPVVGLNRCSAARCR